MLNFKEIQPGEKERFNSFVADSPRGHVFQSYEWGEVKRGDGWRPRRFFVEKDGVIRAAVQILEKRFLFHSVLYAPRGPVLDYHDTEVLDFLTEEIKKLAVRRNAVYFQMDPDITEEDVFVGGHLEKTGFINRPGGFFGVEQPRFVFRLDLGRSEDEIFAGFSSSARRDIRIAERHGVTFEINNSREGLRAHYKLFRETAKRKKFLARPYSFQKRICDELIPEKKANIFFAVYKGEYLVSTLLCHFARKCLYMYVGSDLKCGQLNANAYLVWEMIKWAKANGCEIFDFRGVGAWDIPGHPERGIYEFKRKFSPDFCRFRGEYFLVFNPRVFRTFIKAEAVFRRLLRLLLRIKAGLTPWRNDRTGKLKELSRTVLDKYGEKEELLGYTRLALRDELGYEKSFLDRHITPTGKILVAGCGAGREAIYFAKKGLEVTGIDLQPKMAEEAGKNAEAAGVKAEFMAMDAAKLDFADGHFDHGVMLGVLAYIPGRANRVLALKEMGRVLKKDAELILSVPSKNNGFKRRAYFLLMDNLRRLLSLGGYCALEPGDRFSKITDPGIRSKGKVFFHMYSAAEVREDLLSAGFELSEARSRKEILSGTEDTATRENDYFMCFCARKAGN